MLTFCRCCAFAVCKKLSVLELYLQNLYKYMLAKYNMQINLCFL